MNINKQTRDKIHEAIDEFDVSDEFDSLLIASITGLSIRQTQFILKTMNLQRRILTADEKQIWRSLHGNQPTIIYRVHTGKRPNGYEVGIKAKPRTNPTKGEKLMRQRNDEECATCPEFDTCQGMISPCPRYPDQQNAPIDEVMKLEDF